MRCVHPGLIPCFCSHAEWPLPKVTQVFVVVFTWRLSGGPVNSLSWCSPVGPESRLAHCAITRSQTHALPWQHWMKVQPSHPNWPPPQTPHPVLYRRQGVRRLDPCTPRPWRRVRVGSQVCVVRAQSLSTSNGWVCRPWVLKHESQSGTGVSCTPHARSGVMFAYLQTGRSCSSLPPAPQQKYTFSFFFGGGGGGGGVCCCMCVRGGGGGREGLNMFSLVWGGGLFLKHSV